MAAEDAVPVRSVVGANIKRIRDLRAMTVRDLAARLKTLGLSLSASGVSEVETAQRKLGVDELLVFAVALNTSIVELITPPDRRQPLQITDEIESVPEAYLDWWLQGVRPWPKDADLDEFYTAASATRQHDRMLRRRPDVKAVDLLAGLVYDVAGLVEHFHDHETKEQEWVVEEAARLREYLAKAVSYVNLLADELESYGRGR